MQKFNFRISFNYQINKLNNLGLFSERINSYFTILENDIEELIIMYRWLSFLLFFFLTLPYKTVIIHLIVTFRKLQTLHF